MRAPVRPQAQPAVRLSAIDRGVCRTDVYYMFNVYRLSGGEARSLLHPYNVYLPLIEILAILRFNVFL